MSAQETVEQGLGALPANERTEPLKRAVLRLCPQGGKGVERLWRRLENPDIPEDVWRGIEDAEDGRLVDMKKALIEKPPWVK